MYYSNLLNDKFAMTRLPDICAPRHALLNLFQKEASKRIIYVSAPAGYGKTVSTQLWLKNSGRVALWIGLDEYDNSPSIFYKLFCTGIVSLQPDNTSMAQILTNPTFASSPVENTIRLLSEFIPDDRQYAVVLDDMHLVTNNEIRKSGLLVQKRLPSSFILVILTRNEIAEEYTTIGGECTIITARDLAFSMEEIQKYFNAHGRFVTVEEVLAAHTITNGWAIGVNALAMSGQISQRQNGGQVLRNYIKTQIWDKLNDTMRMFLLKTSVLDEFTPELAQKLTGETNSRKILENLCAGNMFTSKIGEGCFRYHHLFLEFLRETLEESVNIDTGALYAEAAQWFHEKEDYYKAANYYIKCGDQPGITKCLLKVNDYGYDNNVETEFQFAKTFVFDKLSTQFIELNHELTGMCAWVCFLDGDAIQFQYYLDILYNHIPGIIESQLDFMQSVLFLGSLDFRTPLYDYSIELAKNLPIGENAPEMDSKKAKSQSLTQNLPFIHRSMRDYSDFAIDTQTRLSHLESAFGPLIGNEYYVIEDCILAGLFYEKNQLAKAMEYADSAHAKCRPDYGVESKFSLLMILMAVSQTMGRRKVAYKGIADMLEAENATYLKHNLMAYEIRTKLWGGDKQAARAWLENYFVFENGHLEFYKIYRHFITARAYLVLAQTDKAMSFILKLKKLGTDYRRPLDVAEADTLQAALEWAMGNKKEALETLKTALIAMQDYGFVRVFADEGAAVLPILKKIAFNLKKENYESPLDAHFVNEVMIAAYDQSKRHKGITVNIRTQKPVKLSKQQKYVITLLAKGYRNAEIVDITGLTIHTIKAHQAAAYAKLDVNSAMEAVLKARELGLIE